MSEQMQANYRELLSKLIRHRESTEEVRVAFSLASENDDYPSFSRVVARHKSKLLGQQVNSIDYMLARNRAEIASFGLQHLPGGEL